MLQRWWFQAIVIFCIVVSSLTLYLDLAKRQVKHLRIWLKTLVYMPIIVNAVLMPFSLEETFKMSHQYLSNPVIIYANNTTAMAKIVLFFVFALTMQGRDRNLEKWLQTMIEIQTSYFDRYPSRGVAKDMSHRKWLYLSSGIAVLHYVLESTRSSIKNFATEDANIAWFTFFLLLTLQHTLMLVHGTLLCHLRECFSVLNIQMAGKSHDPQLPFIYNRLRCQYRELNRLYGPSMLGVIVCLLLSNSMVGYVALVILLIPDVDADSFRYLFGSLFYGFLLLHWYIYFMLCQKVETTIKDIDVILCEYAIDEGQESGKQVRQGPKSRKENM